MFLQEKNLCKKFVESCKCSIVGRECPLYEIEMERNTMITDFHVHIFPEHMAVRTIEKLAEHGNIKAFLNGTKEELLRSMENASIKRSVILPIATKPEQFHSINRFATELNEEFSMKPFQILSFGSLHPLSGNYKEQLREIKEMGLKGVKFHPDYQSVDIDDIHFMKTIAYASELGLITTIHSGFDAGYRDSGRSAPDKVNKMLEEVRPEKMILAHFGSMYHWDEVEQLFVGKNVYFDTGVVLGKMKKEQFIRMIKNHGSDRVLFATDSPWSSQIKDVEYMQHLKLKKEDYENIMWKNAEKLLNM